LPNAPVHDRSPEFDINSRMVPWPALPYREDMLNEDILWQAVTSRDPQWDGAFVYAVPSTRIYCRPTCPSRRPRRPGVRYFAVPAAAEAEGFRACRRCDPAAAGALPAHVDRVRRVCAAIAARPDARVTLPVLARAVRIDPHHLLRTFKQVLGISPREYADAVRLGCLRAGLRSGNGVAAATYDAGYGSGSRVYERAPAALGMTPAAYAAGGKGANVRYLLTDSPLGRLLVAATPCGVCAVKLGDDDERLVSELRGEYPAAAVSPDDSELAGWVEMILDSLSPAAPDPRLPLDVRATAFQRLVWRELQRIPRGTTRSYREIARRIGRPTAARAVARACATNPVALVVPCHRVVRDDGGLGGYHWGVRRKRALLDAERPERGTGLPTVALSAAGSHAHQEKK
jgi:AraC family transcriptional regulator of adaptative response/methylated-DNA-[protein]-cysteine methyltransferase